MNAPDASPLPRARPDPNKYAPEEAPSPRVKPNEAARCEVAKAHDYGFVFADKSCGIAWPDVLDADMIRAIQQHRPFAIDEAEESSPFVLDIKQNTPHCNASSLEAAHEAVGNYMRACAATTRYKLATLLKV